MTLRANPTFLVELKRYGAFDINACFNCGNCTAVCPLSKDNDSFPRRIIRYGQLGLEDHLVASKELWLCHYCGECSVTCPRQADPAEFMAAARRYAIARLAPGPIAGWFYTSPAAALGGMAVVFLVLSAIFLAGSQGIPTGEFSTAGMMDFVPFEVIHIAGLVVLGLVALVAATTVLSMTWAFSKAAVPGGLGAPKDGPGLFPLNAAWIATREAFFEVFGHRSFRSCADDEIALAGDGPAPAPRPWFLSRWALHYAIMGGFFGLGAATGLDYVLKDPDLFVPIWSPIRLLGTVSGVVFLYGVLGSIVARMLKRDQPSSVTRFSDISFLWLLFLVGITGFAIELAIYLHVAGGILLYGTFLVHLVLAMELLLLLPFTKFAHAMYRPLALWVHNFRRARAG